ncbi:uncharacterized protein LOC108024906 [Drosophila biarmipes]|uniref:uncharacterized protein LOC108024906 n=1 Tax=Drosophila biarmipes TaxID=125945 RepID=UPI0007E73E8E|nr:uncharacterized protein LOC108024906 [Drosophila biarmipes]XP_050742824.1 uncharacterized protein LOC108024906 [Drosophila biarmipes]
MLQPRETYRITDWHLNKKNCLPCKINMICYKYHNQYWSLALLTALILIIVHIEASQGINQPLFVSPTPTLPTPAADDITTVLLLNNKSGHVGDIHGRFLTVRPEIGVLTSTARTFIQDGTTTEFATKILGTTLNSGRLYAQYLRKSSRVLYENDKLFPSVVTSWVGEGDSHQTPLFLQSHNDLFNSDDADWQDIDDSLGVNRGEFVGNTDYVIQQSTKVREQSSPDYQDKPLRYLKPVASSNVTLIFDSKRKDEINKLVDKVSSIENLKTYTIKSHFADFSAPKQTITVLDTLREERKYEMKSRIEQNVEEQKHKSQSFNKQVLASITYYGFAEFTTVVGDSVIVFSPSTTQSTLHFGHVTSIKGKPTLKLMSIHDYNSQTTQTSPSPLKPVPTLNKILSPMSSFGEDIFTSSSEEKSHFKNVLVATSTILSTTKFENVLSEKIDNSSFSFDDSLISNSNEFKNLQSSFYKTNDTSKNLTNHMEANIQKQEGATTVFIDDDPFTNFVEPKNSTSSKLNTADQETVLEQTEIFKRNEIHGSLVYPTVTDVNSESFGNKPVVGTSNENKNNVAELCNHTTSQVFLTQMLKTPNVGDDRIVIDVNPLFAYNIVETTKYYCIQASQTEKKVELNDGNTTQETVLEPNKKVMSAELIDDVDETTVRESEDYDVTTENDYENEEEDYYSVTDDVDLLYKTLFTTYTYLTTFFEGSRTTISSHTEIITNIVSSTLASNVDFKSKILDNIAENQKSENTIRMAGQEASPLLHKFTIPVEIASLLSQESKINPAEKEITNQLITTYLDDFKYSKTLYTTYTYYTSIFTDNDTEIQTRTEIVTNYITEKISNNQTNYIMKSSDKTSKLNTSASEIEKENHMTFEIGVNTSSLSNMDSTKSFIKKSPLDDQVSSESNTEEIIPSATFLLQTSFTTFTFYTTMYVGNDTNIISRLETVTNVGTETLQPTKQVNLEDSFFPITYYTTFTYWTKLAKDGEITTLSREETISNVIQPSNVTVLSVDDENSSQSDGDTIVRWKSDYENTTIFTLSDQNLHSDITTYYTTYTYYTTSYDVNKTIIDSRFETITNVVTSKGYSIVMSGTSAIDLMLKPSQPVTSIDNQIRTGVPDFVLYDYKQIIDADEVSTLYFTTEIKTSMNSEGHDILVTSSTSRLQIDESKKSILATLSANSLDDGLSSLKLYKTGLVRLIEGKRIQNSTTTLYQSKVIGTVIDNRYAQIIESTSSFFFEESQSDVILLPTTVAIPHVGNVNSHESTKTTGYETDEHTVLDSDLNSDGLSNYALQSSKRLVAPVIRPFASRNRPTFAPKQKTLSPSSATIITRSDITPTITATPALKSAGRYSSSRRGIISNVPINPYESNLFQGQPSRRLFGRPTKSNSIESDTTLQSNIVFLPSKNRFASTLRPVVSSRRQNINISYRSSNIPGFRVSATSNSRLRIKPTNSGLVVSDRFTQSTTLTKELSSESSFEEENATDEVADEEENARRNSNPLLRLRRPINGPSGFSPVSRPTSISGGVSLRRNPLSVRPKISTTTTTSTTTTVKPRPRSFQRPIGLQPRIRPQNTLFPPRGLFQNHQKDESFKDVKTNNSDSTNYSEFEEDEANHDEEYNSQEKIHRNKRSFRILRSARYKNRVRRQTDTVKKNRFRFRRQNQTSTFTKDELKLMDSEIRAESTSSPRDKSSSRFGSRFYSPQGQDLHAQVTLMDSTTAKNLRTIRPTRLTTKRPQFTLREKDATLKGTTRSSTTNNFRRQQTIHNTSVRRAVGQNTGNSSTRRLKSYANYNNKNNVDHGRLSSTTRSRNGNSNTLNRGRSRGRNRIEYPSDSPSIDNEVQTITVTHFLPSEVTIPVVSGHVTEYKNIVTAKTSTELLGPNEYMKVLGTNGLSSTYLNREVSSINIAGATEHTKYLLHESITSAVIFTPTTIRGRKTSFSHIIPSTAYSVENVVTTIPPQISDNAPLANILLSQLLLGNLNLPAHPLIGAVGQPNAASVVIPTEPITEYRTHTSTYVTTIFDGKSTILPVTFQGKKILTTVYDTTAQTITATEYSVDTIVSTPPSVQNIQSVGPAAHVNNLLLQQLLIQQQQESLSLAQSITNTLPPPIFLGEHLQDLDDFSRSLLKKDGIDADIGSVSNESQFTKSHRKKSRKGNSGHKRNKENQMTKENPDPSVVTLYVSGRRPGEFSTILSTVGSEFDHSVSLQKRHAFIEITTTDSIPFFSYTTQSSNDTSVSKGETASLKMDVGLTELSDRTASLESIVGDVDLWYAKSSRQPIRMSTTINSVDV